jgi:hypothetical protein
MKNDRGAYYLLILTDVDGMQTSFDYDNAESARGHARLNEHSNPNGTRHLFKMLPNHEPIEVMV